MRNRNSILIKLILVIMFVEFFIMEIGFFEILNIDNS